MAQSDEDDDEENKSSEASLSLTVSRFLVLKLNFDAEIYFHFIQ